MGRYTRKKKIIHGGKGTGIVNAEGKMTDQEILKLTGKTREAWDEQLAHNVIETIRSRVGDDHTDWYEYLNERLTSEEVDGLMRWLEFFDDPINEPK